MHILYVSTGRNCKPGSICSFAKPRDSGPEPPSQIQGGYSDSKNNLETLRAEESGPNAHRGPPTLPTRPCGDSCSCRSGPESACTSLGHIESPCRTWHRVMSGGTASPSPVENPLPSVRRRRVRRMAATRPHTGTRTNRAESTNFYCLFKRKDPV